MPSISEIRQVIVIPEELVIPGGVVGDLKNESACGGFPLTTAGMTERFAGMTYRPMTLGQRAVDILKGTGEVGLTIASLKAAGFALDKAGPTIERVLGVNPFGNPALDFFAVIKGAQAIDNALMIPFAKAGEFLEFVKPFSFSGKAWYASQALKAKAAELLAAHAGLKALTLTEQAAVIGRSLFAGRSLLSITAGLGKTLFAEGKLLSWLPETTFRMGDGCLVSNVLDAAVGRIIEEKFGAETRGFVNTLAFFSPSFAHRLSRGYLTELFTKGPLNKMFGPLALFAGAGFAYGISMDAMRYSAFGRQADYTLSVGGTAYEEIKRIDPGARVFELVGGADLAANLYAGDNFLSVLYEGYEWFLWKASLRELHHTAAHIRHKVYKYNHEMAKEQVEAIRDYLLDYLSTPHTSASELWDRTARTIASEWDKDGLFGKVMDQLNEGPSVNEWGRLIRSRWLERVDTRVLLDAAALPTDLVASISNTANIFEPPSKILWHLFSSEILRMDEIEKKGALELAGANVMDPKRRAELLMWLGGENAILERRRRLFMAELVRARLSGNENMLKLGVEAGFMKNTEEFAKTGLYFSVLSDYAEIATAGRQKEITSLQRYFEHCYIKYTQEDAKGNAGSAGYYLANMMMMDPGRLYGAGSKEEEFYNRLITHDMDLITLSGDQGPLLVMPHIAYKIERLVALDLAYHIVLCQELGLAPLEGPAYDEAKMTSELKRALRFREVSGSMGKAGRLLRLFKQRMALDDREAVTAAVDLDIQQIRAGFDRSDRSRNIAAFKEVSSKAKGVFKAIKEYMDQGLLTDIEFLEDVKKISELSRSLEEMAVYWKKMGVTGSMFNGAINRDGTIGDMNAFKKWIE